MLYSSKNFVEILNKTILPLYASEHLHGTSSQYANFGAKKVGTVKMARILPFFLPMMRHVTFSSFRICS